MARIIWQSLIKTLTGCCSRKSHKSFDYLSSTVTSTASPSTGVSVEFVSLISNKYKIIQLDAAILEHGQIPSQKFLILVGDDGGVYKGPL